MLQIDSFLNYKTKFSWRGYSKAGTLIRYGCRLRSSSSRESRVAEIRESRLSLILFNPVIELLKILSAKQIPRLSTKSQRYSG